MINSHNVTKHACTSSWLPLAHSVHHTYHQVTVMDKQQKKQRLYTTHIYIYIYIYHVNVTQTVPDISPLMPMHQDTLLVDEMSWHACVTTALDTLYCRHFHSLFALPWWPGGWDCVVVWTPLVQHNISANERSRYHMCAAYINPSRTSDARNAIISSDDGLSPDHRQAIN